ncbi:MAG: hypothetical protein NT010_06525 [Proteobacteria bacterium]|nr:hypothetical protein [Pseudomonadota bacterium]
MFFYLYNCTCFCNIEHQKKLLGEEKHTLDKIEKGCLSCKFDMLLGDNDFFDVPAIEQDPMEETKTKISSVIEVSMSVTVLLRERWQVIIITYR